MFPRALGLVLVLFASAPALAQGEDDAAVPEPPSAGSEPVSDAELIRWAAREVRIHEGRRAERHPPIPPDGYVGASVDRPGAALDGATDDLLRVLAEVGVGSLGLLLGAGVGGLLVWSAHELDADPIWTMVAVGAGSTIAAFGVTLGVVLGGEAVDGRGNFGHAFIGQLMGSALTLPFVTLAMAEDRPELAVLAVALFPLAGAILGYELSHASRDGGLRLLSVVSPTPGGVVLGLAGAGL